jgi:hypothetical protein
VRRSALACLAALCALGASGAHAASQGAVGATSSGSIGITVSIAPRVRISVAEGAPVQQAAFQQSGRVERSACLWSNTATRGFRLVAAEGPTHNLARNAAVTAAPVRPECARAGGASASLRVDLQPAGLQNASLSGKVPGALTLLVVPE